MDPPYKFDSDPKRFRNIIAVSMVHVKWCNASGSSKREVIMVDPAEAKRLAAKQMVEIRRKERLKRRREIEAINGAWAMIGLTAGLVIEGYSGKTIIEQLAGYLSAIVHIFIR
ncbi:unnamed protein product [Linum tenue]|uniref:Uncharacterized protein n=1 Tax=Linum tenue TaxID=586396 RepID=A0AAV0L319_9ROSI|nr:unnamed protein product [Linum tenue]